MEKEQLEKLIDHATTLSDIFGKPDKETCARLLSAARDYLYLLNQPSNTQMNIRK